MPKFFNDDNACSFLSKRSITIGTGLYLLEYYSFNASVVNFNLALDDTPHILPSPSLKWIFFVDIFFPMVISKIQKLAKAVITQGQQYPNF